MADGSWREKSFAGSDGVFHVAGIAHVRENRRNAHLYYEINGDLAIETAKKAKNDGVKQFIFLSSMSVYGMDTGAITKETPPDPKSHYGRSKYMAELGLLPLEDGGFSVCILRVPMVYGSGCKGNFQRLVKMVKASPVFPNVKNERSMVYIDHLSLFVKQCVDEELCGVYFPQNREYMSTRDMALWISEALHKKIRLDPITGACVRILRRIHPTAKKAFGSLVYDMKDGDREYCVIPQRDSVKESVVV
jgi:UDP-glucose 4-epimerase